MNLSRKSVIVAGVILRSAEFSLPRLTQPPLLRRITLEEAKIPY
jgi:hypothetical protein